MPDDSRTPEEVLADPEATDEDKRAAEAKLVRQTDNGPRPEDGDQALAVAPPPELDVLTEDER